MEPPEQWTPWTRHVDPPVTPPRRNRENDKDYRRRLQATLVSDFSDVPENEPAEVHEYEFVARMEAAGHRVKWIPRDTETRRRPTTSTG